MPAPFVGAVLGYCRRKATTTYHKLDCLAVEDTNSERIAKAPTPNVANVAVGVTISLLERKDERHPS